MEVILLMVLSICLLMLSVIKNVFIGYPLIVCWLLFLIYALKKGYKFKDILFMSYEGGKKAFIVINILLLIGAVISLWMISGTIPSLVYYCLKYISPSSFLLSAFLISCVMSFLIGTSLGTVSTVGVPLIILAKSGNINLNMVAGAVMAGAYFGDRCSPMSSSAVLVANLTQTHLFTNIKNMLRTSILSVLLSIIFYGILSQNYPLQIMNNSLPLELTETFKIGVVLLIPALIIIILSLLKVRIQITMLISILVAFILSLTVQKVQLKEILYAAFWGFHLDHGALQNIMKGGGIFPMLKTTLVIYISCSLAGVFEGIQVFDRLKNSLLKMELEREKRFSATLIVSTIAAAFGCTQTIAVIITSEIMKVCYGRGENEQFSLDIENSGILVSALIPWNIAALVPTTTMNVSTAGYIPFAVYLYILPLVYLIATRFKARKADVTVHL